MRKILIGNWKMQLSVRESVALARAVRAGVKKIKTAVVVCPAFPALSAVGSAVRGGVLALGAQDLFWEAKGQFTGEVSGAMLRELGCSFVIVGHSERRAHLGETDEMVNKKIAAALAARLTPILCVGETREERERGERDAVLRRQVHVALRGLQPSQIKKVIVAYEPVWVIGSGKAVPPADAVAAHGRIRSAVNEVAGEGVLVRVIYGGSVDSKNAAGFLREAAVDGCLVGGASLRAAEFLKLARIAETLV